jgi:hypothetical protein
MTGLSGQDRLDRAARIELPAQDCQNETARAEEKGKDSQENIIGQSE